MKQCPSCKATYADETLRYCLADGSVLVDVTDEQTTFVRHADSSAVEKTIVIDRGETIRVEVPRDTPQQRPAATIQQTAPVSPSGAGGILKIVILVIGFLFLSIIALGVGGFIFYLNTGGPAANLNNQNVNPQTSPAPAKSDKDELRDQIANLERLLNEQKNSKEPANIPLTMPNQSNSTTTAIVDSPSDGFLALRTLPSSDIGSRILKIPHGASVAVGGCGPVIPQGKRRGRWCQASFGGYDGWVFDAYLVY